MLIIVTRSKYIELTALNNKGRTGLVSYASAAVYVNSVDNSAILNSKSTIIHNSTTLEGTVCDSKGCTLANLDVLAGLSICSGIKLSCCVLKSTKVESNVATFGNDDFSINQYVIYESNALTVLKSCLKSLGAFGLCHINNRVALKALGKCNRAISNHKLKISGYEVNILINGLALCINVNDLVIGLVPTIKVALCLSIKVCENVTSLFDSCKNLVKGLRLAVKSRILRKCSIHIFCYNGIVSSISLLDNATDCGDQNCGENCNNSYYNNKLNNCETLFVCVSHFVFSLKIIIFVCFLGFEIKLCVLRFTYYRRASLRLKPKKVLCSKWNDRAGLFFF